jgi:hypothetical protein
MSEEQKAKYISESEYLEFVKTRLENSNYRAEEKLKRIDELGDAIFIARKNYRDQNKK